MNPDTKLRNMTAIYISRGSEMLMLYRIGSRVVEPSWCGIGGHFEQTELNDPKACVLRELFEEINLGENDLENLQLRYVTLRLKKGEIRQNYYYFATLREDVELTMESEEGRVCWIPFDELLEKEMPLTAKQMLRHYMSVGRFNDKLYSGSTQENDMVFAELREF
ncbi:NUDIX domain-containing protein [Ihubacter sp. mB4P-1]|uniref:NUDIX domain-containing protein n=1 Tax=Ihubacter sp. mB4P-1 TaxID=3242370 RepID=UPI00137A545E